MRSKFVQQEKDDIGPSLGLTEDSSHNKDALPVDVRPGLEEFAVAIMDGLDWLMAIYLT